MLRRMGVPCMGMSSYLFKMASGLLFHFKPVRLGGQLLFSYPFINMETKPQEVCGL